MLCSNKYAESDGENTLFDAPRRGRNAENTDDEKARYSGNCYNFAESASVI